MPISEQRKIFQVLPTAGESGIKKKQQGLHVFINQHTKGLNIALKMKLDLSWGGNKKKVSIDHLQCLTFEETFRICCSAATYSTIQAFFSVRFRFQIHCRDKWGGEF